jgi:hypothetical protein
MGQAESNSNPAGGAAPEPEVIPAQLTVDPLKVSAIKTTAATTPKSAKSALEQMTDESDLFKDGRYRVAKQGTVDQLALTQAGGSTQAGMPNPQQFPGTPEGRKEFARKHIKESEGLDIGFHERRKLAQQWRFFLSCEPIQRGMDAGIILGSVTAVVAAYQPKNRHPLKVVCFWMAGFSAGMIVLPACLLLSEISNQRRLKAREHDLYDKQRKLFTESQGKQI